MHRMSASACVDAPAAVVWEHFARLDQIHLWTDLIHHARTEGGCHRGGWFGQALGCVWVPLLGWLMPNPGGVVL